MSKPEMFAEALRLYDLGFGVHWLRPKSKAPIEKEWASGTRQSVGELTDKFRPEYGLGVRLGNASKLPDGSFLGAVDIDIKSAEPRHREEALAFVRVAFPGLLEAKGPSVTTGYGLRPFIRTPIPGRNKKLGKSAEMTRVKMPTEPINDAQRKWIGKKIGGAEFREEDLTAGWRVRPAWEVELMGAKRQVVLPPSIHPDTGKQYLWGVRYEGPEGLPLVEGVADVPELPRRVRGAQAGADGEPFQWKVVPVDLMDARFTPGARQLLLGEGVRDRSASLLTVSILMVRGGFERNEILSCLTDPQFFLGKCAYDHTRGGRDNAAEWVARNTLEAAYKAVDGVSDAGFDSGVVEVVDGGLWDAQVAEMEATGEIREVDWRAALARTDKGGFRVSLRNVVLILGNTLGSRTPFRLNEFARKVFYWVDMPWALGKAGRAIEDHDILDIRNWLNEKWGFDPGTGMTWDAVNLLGSWSRFNPVREWMAGLGGWDGVERLRGWLWDHFGAREGGAEYLGDVFEKWLVGAVRRVWEPGSKFDWLPILEGKQGKGKSSFGALLAGQDWFCDQMPPLADKDAALQLQGNLIVEFGELDSLRRSELATVKAFITRQVDIVRPPYGRSTVEMPRSCVFFGTVDQKEYLIDEAGNRRFMPVKVDQLDFDALKRDRDQLWAEALWKYRWGNVSPWMEGTSLGASVELQRSKIVEDESVAMQDILAQAFNAILALKRENWAYDFGRIGLMELWDRGPQPLAGFRREMKMFKMAGKALRFMGFEDYKSYGIKYWRLADEKAPWLNK